MEGTGGVVCWGGGRGGAWCVGGAACTLAVQLCLGNPCWAPAPCFPLAVDASHPAVPPPSATFRSPPPPLCDWGRCWYECGVWGLGIRACCAPQFLQVCGAGAVTVCAAWPLCLAQFPFRRGWRGSTGVCPGAWRLLPHHGLGWHRAQQEAGAVCRGRLPRRHGRVALPTHCSSVSGGCTGPTHTPPPAHPACSPPSPTPPHRCALAPSPALWYMPCVPFGGWMCTMRAQSFLI